MSDVGPGPSPIERLQAIVDQGLCIGCGLCQAVAGPAIISVGPSPSGYLEPMVVGELSHDTVDTIYDVCPGTRIDGLPPNLLGSDTTLDPVWGPWRRMVLAWAADPEVRFEGSTGGVLTALAQYLLTSGRVEFIAHVTASSLEPTHGEPTVSETPAQVLAAAGSRYGPTAPLLNVAELLDRGRPFAFIAKPCDLAALRNWARHDDRVDELVRYWLTPVCGGFGPPAFTRGFLDRMGIDPATVTGFRYRGRGCPGPTRVEVGERVHEFHYLDYWGDDESHWSLPWRCRICPDGIGESADIAAADTWPGGSPDREAGVTDPGTNAVVARTVVGQELLEAAERDGAVIVERAITPAELSDYQPHQVAKKYAVAPRFQGMGDMGRLVPVTHGLRIDELAARQPPAENERQRAGTRTRIIEGRT